MRALSDFEYEFQRALFAKYLDDDIETVFIMTNNKYSFVSSTGIRELAKFGGKLDGLVPDDVKEKLEEQSYDCEEDLALILSLSESLHKPILLEGPAGVGKTELAKAYAKAMERPLLRLQCYEGLDERHALYEWNYQKQLLYF